MDDVTMCCGGDPFHLACTLENVMAPSFGQSLWGLLSLLIGASVSTFVYPYTLSTDTCHLSHAVSGVIYVPSVPQHLS